MASIPLLDLHQYHHVDRVLFSHIVMQLSRDPAESLLAMAFWFWLEDKHYLCLVTKLLKASDFIVNKVVDETLICLNSLAFGEPIPPNSSTTFITYLLEQTLPLEMMHQDKTSTINRIKYFLNDVCARVFTDILHQAITESGARGKELYDRLTIAGFPHPIFGDVTILNLPLHEHFLVDDLWGWSMRI